MLQSNIHRFGVQRFRKKFSTVSVDSEQGIMILTEIIIFVVFLSVWVLFHVLEYR